MSRLERWSWIASIGGAVIGAAALAWTIWSPAPPPGVVANTGGNGNVVIQGNNNTIALPAPKEAARPRFMAIKISDAMLPVDGNRKHMVRYPVISGMEAVDTQAKVNHQIKRAVQTLYETYSDVDEVDIGYQVGFKEFNLIGLNIGVFMFGDGAAHPFTTTQTLVINLEDAKPFTLKDMFKSGYEEKLNQLVIAGLRRKELYFPCVSRSSDSKEEKAAEQMVRSVLENISGHSAETCYSGFDVKSQFYLTDTSLVLVYPKYSVAPGFAGDVAVPVNYRDIGGLLNPTGPLSRFL
jgi:hypothetical protein